MSEAEAPAADTEAAAAPAPLEQRPGFGALLAQARAQAGLSLEEVATRLRLHARQVEAIEAENFGALPSAPYVSGFVRNYARELKLDPAALIEDLHGKLEQLGGSLATLDLRGTEGPRLPILDERRWRQLVLTAIVLVLVCGGLIGAWIAHQRTRAAQAPAAAAEAAPALSAAAGAPGPAAAAAEPAPAPGPDNSPPATRPATESARPPAPSGTAPSAAPPQATAAALAQPAPQRATNGLVLRFNDRSWVEVSDAEGRVLLSRTGDAGSLEMLNTAAPLQLVVGRADAVVVEYRGQAVDLKPFVTGNGVARVTLADGRVSSGGQSIR